MKNETDFDSYDPQRIYTGEDLAFFGATIMRSLVAYKYSADPAEATTLVPDMATDTGTSNADATSWTFTLRDGLTWQDGSPVTCDDIKYGVSRTFAGDVINGGPTYAIEFLDIPKADDGSSAYKGPYSREGQDLFDRAVSCDANTITFKLAASVPDFSYATTLGFGAVPNPVDHPGVDTGENYVGDAVWSDGPYKITSYSPGSTSPAKGGSLILSRNDEWNRDSDLSRGAYPDMWEADFGLDPQRIDARIIGSTGADAFAIDYSPLQPGNLSDVFAQPDIALPAFEGRAFSSPNSVTSYYWINTMTVPNRDIRAAIAAALDREAIRQDEGGDFAGELADGAINPSIGQDYAPTGLWDTLLGQQIPPNGDPAYAQTLIAQSGQAAPTLTWTYSYTPPPEFATVKQSLEQAGFKVELKQLPSSGSTVFNPAQEGDIGNYPRFCSDWRADYPNASTVIAPIFTADGGCDYSNVDDTSGVPDWIEQVNVARSTLDRAAQALKWQNLNREAVDQVWIIPILFGLEQHIAGTNVAGTYRWGPYGSWPYAQLYAKSSG